MNECQSCHTPLPPGAVRCPRCNTPASSTADPTTNAVPFMDFGPFMEMESASMPPAASAYQTPSQPLEIGAYQQAQQPLLSGQVPGQQSSPYLYPQAPHAVSYPAQSLPVMPVLPALPAPAQTQPRRNSTLIKTLLIVLLVVLIFIGSGIIYFATLAHSAASHPHATANVSATATNNADSPQAIFARATSGTPTINDALSDPLSSLWPQFHTAHGSSTFTNGAYQIAVHEANLIEFSTPSGGDFANVAFQVQMTLISGDAGGILLRSNRGSSGTDLNTYMFRMNRDGSYQLRIHQGANQGRLLTANYSTAITTGVQPVNTLTVIAENSTLYLYVNTQFLTSFNDNTFSVGYIGLFAESISTVPTIVSFSNAKAWVLP